ncbi:hypothetical protein [Streptomyces sp. NPDC051109]|uniref:hypothetical protein n=1 Tax=Streptomyces sp. NPDC051109 TaxID=3365642 RepID=UPI00378D12E2
MIRRPAADRTRRGPGALRSGSVFHWSVQGLADTHSTVEQVVPRRRTARGGPAPCGPLASGQVERWAASLAKVAGSAAHSGARVPPIARPGSGSAPVPSAFAPHPRRP